jgi:hypothetical protein
MSVLAQNSQLETACEAPSPRSLQKLQRIANRALRPIQRRSDRQQCDPDIIERSGTLPQPAPGLSHEACAGNRPSAFSERPPGAATCGLEVHVMNDEPLRIPIEGEIDLHAFAPRDVVSVVTEYVEAAAAAGLAEVRIVHGRGRGVQRGLVQSALEQHPCVVEFWDDTDSHLGATIARLRRKT